MNGRMVEMFKYVMTMAPWPGWAQLTQQTLLLVTTSWADLCSEYSGTGTHLYLCITMSMIARVCPLPPGQGVVLTWARVKGWEVAVVRSRQG